MGIDWMDVLPIASVPVTLGFYDITLAFEPDLSQYLLSMKSD